MPRKKRVAATAAPEEPPVPTSAVPTAILLRKVESARDQVAKLAETPGVARRVRFATLLLDEAVTHLTEERKRAGRT